MYIYLITNKLNGKQYVGQTIQKNARKRWTDHLSEARNGSSMVLHHAIRRHGSDNFSFEVIDECRSSDELNEAEKEWIEKLGTFSRHGYNSTSGGDSCIRSEMSEDAKQRISKALTGRRLSEETKEKIRLANIGKKYSDELKYKCGSGSRGRKQSLEEIKNRANKNRGKVRPPSAIQTTTTKTSIGILQYDLDGILISTHTSLSEASRKTHISVGNICTVCKGRRTHAGGYIWKYA